MHGTIWLDSVLGSGTIATFTIPFTKPQYAGSTAPFVDASTLSDRLRSEPSVSGCNSDSDLTHNGFPQDTSDEPRESQVRWKTKVQRPSLAATSKGRPTVLTEADRKNTHVLVVEDK